MQSARMNMSICPNCGTQNADGMIFCSKCNKELPRMQAPQSAAPQYQPYQPQTQYSPPQAYQQTPPPAPPQTWQQPAAYQQPPPGYQPMPQYGAPPAKNNTLLIIGAIIIAAIVIVAVIALVVLSSNPVVKIDSYSANSFFGTGLMVQFTVHVNNSGNQPVQKTILCTVIFNNGDSASNSLTKAIPAGLTTQTILVPIINVVHYAEVQGKTWASDSCIFI